MRNGLWMKSFVFGIIGLFIVVSFSPVFMADNKSKYYDVSQESVFKKTNSPYIQNNILISSDNSQNDMHPKITKNAGTMVVAYEKADISDQTIQVTYSDTMGQTWIPKFNFNSKDSVNGSGFLQNPDIKYAPMADEIFLAMIDPFAKANNLNLVWIPGNIKQANNVKIWRNTTAIGLYGITNYSEVSCTYVDQWFMSLYTYDVPAGMPWNQEYLTKTLALIYLYHNKTTNKIHFPLEDKYPGGVGYYDAEYFLDTAPSYNPEMATGSNRVYLVSEHYNDTSNEYQIVFKSTVTDIKLLFSGGGFNTSWGEFDRYSDIEFWPWQRYLLKGTDPDISANQNYVYVVCSQKNTAGDCDVICAYSSDDGDSWNYSYVANEQNIDEMYPAVYATENEVYCSYVKSGNLYLFVSKDRGFTWGEPVLINEVDGSVVEEPGTVDLSDVGVVWTDSRNGNKDIFFNEVKPIINIDVRGGFGLSIQISNNGFIPTSPIDWKITIDGPLVFFVESKSGHISEILPSESITIKSLLLGIGQVTITIQIGDVIKSTSGYIMGPFVIIL